MVTAFLFPAGDVGAAVYVSDKAFAKDEVWTAKAGPYYVSGNNVLNAGSTLRVAAGTKIIFQGGKLEVLGSFRIEGSETAPASVILDRESSGFSVRGGNLDINHAKVSGGNMLIEAYGSASVAITNSDISDIAGQASAVSVFGNSTLVVSDSLFSNIKTGTAFDIFQGSATSIERTEFSGAGLNRIIQVFNGGPNITSVHIADSGIAGCTTGIEVFDGSIASMSRVEINGCSGSGILAHGNSSVEITSSAISENRIGIEQYFASTTVSASTIEKNTVHGAYVHGGTFDSDGNWWGSETGPYGADFNPQGQGDSIAGQTDPYPWLTESPKREPCCSSVLFIPGFQGSRLFKRSGLFENQLWEPNRNTDVKKLYLSAEGIPIESSIYAKDIIGRTNIGLGLFDKDVYDPVVGRLNLIKSQEKIQSWQSFPYDWRLDPMSVVQGEALSRIETLAKASKTKKVTLVAHSYGGIVAKEMIRKLQQVGKAALIDRLVLVGVPEQGSMEAAASLLHGDNQSIAGGMILKNHIARTMGLNSPSAYYLLPKDGLFASADAPIIQFKTGKWFGSMQDITSKAALDGFLGAALPRPTSLGSADVTLPAKINAGLRERMEASGLNEYAIPQSISIFNIVGTGIKTLRGISYVDKGCGLFGVLAAFGDPYCGLDHRPLLTDGGDGTVPVGLLPARLGNKIVFEMGEFNRDKSQNIEHSNMLTVFPILDKIEYILTHRGTSTLNQSVAYMEEVGTGSSVAAISEMREAYQFVAIPDNRQVPFLSLTDESERNTGIKRQHETIHGVMPESNIPNSSFREFGGSAYATAEHMPKKVSASLGDAGSITLEGNKLGNEGTETMFIFKDIPVIEDSRLEISVSDSPSQPTFELRIDFDGNGTVDDRILYASSGLEPGTHATSSQAIGSGYPPPELAIQAIKKEIASSSVSKKFKERYLLKVGSAESQFMKGKGSEAAKSVLAVMKSLAAITKELSRARAVYYKGGMSYPEATFLYARFSSLYLALRQAFP